MKQAAGVPQFMCCQLNAIKIMCGDKCQSATASDSSAATSNSITRTITIAAVKARTAHIYHSEIDIF